MARALLDGSAMTKRRRRARGFTLVELAVVVVIVGVLAVIAVVGYRKMILSAKLTEARNVISAIKIAQEDYKAERGIYANLGAGLCPTNGSTQSKTQWDNTSCLGGAWKQLPVHVDGPVQFGYATCAGTGAAVDNCGATWVTGWNNQGGKPWFTIYAQADLDGQGGLFTQLASGSGTNQIFTQNEGE